MKDQKSKLVQALNQVLASTYGLYLQTQNFHWNVRGSHFHSLHEMFQDQYEEYASAIDLIAEHIRTYQVIVPGTFESMSKFSQLEQKEGGLSDSEMLETLVAMNKQMIELLTQTAELADKDDALEAEDLMIQRLHVHRKHLWMLESSLEI